jgi:dTDP-4-amino-4,6-dideoxygalactose transaminase
VKFDIPFNKPYTTGLEQQFISDVLSSLHHSGDGQYSYLASTLLSDALNGAEVLLTPSCTSALEICALLLDIEPGDEIIMPSYTFVSTANAFILRGATIKFIDISHANLCLDIDLIEHSITSKTKAVVCVHYAGVSCDMFRLRQLCDDFNLFLIEDAAQAINAFFKGTALGTFGDLSTFSFHETKNISSGEGGALVINNLDFLDRAHIIREKGTNRRAFFKGFVDKYGWQDIGSSFLMNEITAAHLYAQLLSLEKITKMRLSVWDNYKLFFDNIHSSCFQLPSISTPNQHNAHIFYLLFSEAYLRDDFISFMKQHSILCPFHYIPLHSSPYFIKHNFCPHLPVTDKISKTIVRLPLWPHLSNYEQNKITNAISLFASSI